MLFLYITLISSSLFVPYTNEESLLLVPMNMTQIIEVIPEIPKLVVFVHDPLSSTSINSRKSLIDSIPLFQFDLIFAELDARNSTSLLEQLGATAPYILFYANSTLWGHYPFPTSETTLLYLLNLLADGTRPPIVDNTSLYRSLGTSYYSLLYPANEKIKAHNIHRYVSSKIGFVDLIPFNAQLDTFLDPNYFYFFRIEDLYLTKIHKDNVSITTIINCAKPLFKRISPEDFISNTNLTFAISITGLTPYLVDILEKVARSFPRITVGFVEKPLHNFLNFSTSGTIKRIPSVSILNTTSRKFYKIPQIINDKIYNNDFTVINDIPAFLSNLSEPISISEPINDTVQSGVVHLVGLNHDQFVLNDQFDSVVLYYSRNTPITKQFIRIFKEASDLLLNVSQIKFGMINTTCNAASFPLMPFQPHIEIYPKNHKDDSYEFFGQPNVHAIVRFIKDYSTCDIPFNPRNSTEKEDNMEIYQIFSEIPSLNEKEKIKAEKRLKTLAVKLNINLTEILKNDNL